ncbi:MAG TPA: GrpB family protein [Caulobacteraceae bacterium]|nr:GrpB family protein [Caulobacteraceae bacterium]
MGGGSRARCDRPRRRRLRLDGGGLTGADPYGLGLAPGVNRLAAHNPLWARAAEEEIARLRTALGPAALAIEHYGSTSVPGLMAKPIIDLQIGVADIALGLDFVDPLTALGYDYAGSQGIPDHHIFGRGAARTHLAHVVVFGGEQWTKTLRFRDRLRSDPSVRAAYEALKLDLAARVATRAEYTAGKAAFIERMSG